MAGGAAPDGSDMAAASSAWNGAKAVPTRAVSRKAALSIAATPTGVGDAFASTEGPRRSRPAQRAVAACRRRLVRARKDEKCGGHNCSIAGTVTKVHAVAHDSEADLVAAIAGQPVSVAVEADQSVFQHYKDGVMEGNCGTKLDHAVLAVGYGVEAQTNKSY